MAEITQTMYALKEMAELLIKHQELHEGFYELNIEFQMFVGSVGPNQEAALPGAMMGVSRIGLTKVPMKTPHSVDAAEVNPQSSTDKQTTTSRRKPKSKA